jgi:hypothetical protein
MSDGKYCPRCKSEIGLWPIFSAGLPNRIRCPSCDCRLSYQRTGVYSILLIGLLITVVMGAYYVARSIAGNTEWRLVFVGIVIGTWSMIEFLSSLYLRNNKNLVIWSKMGAQPSRPARSDEVSGRDGKKANGLPL